MRRSRFPIAFAVSLLLHGVLLLIVIRRAIEPPRQAPTPLVVDLRYIPSPRHATGAPSRRSSTVEPSTRGHGPATARPLVAAAQPSAGNTPPPAPVDAPHSGASLLPRLGGGPGIFLGNGEPSSHGHTLRNEPGSEPDPKAVAAYQAERAAKRVEGWAVEGLADARAQRGLVNGYFDDVKRALEEDLNAAPPAIDRRAFEDPKRIAAAAGDKLAEQARNYAATGNPLGAVDPERADVETRYSGNAQAMLRDPGGQSPGASIAAALENMAPARELVRHVADEMKLSAVVELLQARDGKVRTAKLTRTSGNKAFDDGVLAAAPRAIGRLGPPAGPGLGTNAEQIRSVWEFQGRLRYSKKASAIGSKDKVALAADTAVSVLTGQATFDETRGEVSLLDLGHPTLEFTARLLTLY